MAVIKTFSNMKLIDIELKVNSIAEHNDVISVEFFPKKDDLYDAVLTYESVGLDVIEAGEELDEDEEAL